MAKAEKAKGDNPYAALASRSVADVENPPKLPETEKAEKPPDSPAPTVVDPIPQPPISRFKLGTDPLLIAAFELLERIELGNLMVVTAYSAQAQLRKTLSDIKKAVLV